MEQCKGYCGVSCVNGMCPISLADEYQEMGFDVIRDCSDCIYYKGCEDCAFEGTEYCQKEGDI